MKNFKRLLASFATLIMLFVLTPIATNAEWKSDSHGWWYAEGSGWAVGWKQIGDNWYYFDKDGYMVSNIIIDGYILGIDGAWTENDPDINATFPTDKINIKNYKITVFYEKATGKIVKCVDGVKSYSELDASTNQENLEKVYGIVVIEKDVEVQYGFENFKVVDGKVVFRN